MHARTPKSASGPRRVVRTGSRPADTSPDPFPRRKRRTEFDSASRMAWTVVARRCGACWANIARWISAFAFIGRPGEIGLKHSSTCSRNCRSSPEFGSGDRRCGPRVPSSLSWRGAERRIGARRLVDRHAPTTRRSPPCRRMGAGGDRVRGRVHRGGRAALRRTVVGARARDHDRAAHPDRRQAVAAAAATRREARDVVDRPQRRRVRRAAW